MRVRLDELAKRLGGEVAGDGSVEITGVGGIREARPGQITFLANPKYEVYLPETGASAVILGGDHPDIAKPALRCANPYVAFLKAVKLFSADHVEVAGGIHPSAVIGAGVSLGAGASIGPHVVIGDAAVLGDGVVLMAGVYVGARTRIGRGTFVYPNAVIREEVAIGERVLIHAGAVIGDDGFGFAKDGKCYLKIPQVGNVVIEDDVEIGANTTIDRATTGTTRIGRGTRIDNLVQVAHNVVIGQNCIICAQVGISGSTEVCDNVTLAGQAGLVGHIRIGENVMVGAQSGVTKSIPPDTQVSGYPAQPHGVARRIYASLKTLPELARTVKDLLSRVERLESPAKKEE